MDINLTQPLEHPPVFYSLSHQELFSCGLLFLMTSKVFAFNFPCWFSQEVTQQVSLPTPQKRADVLMTQRWVPV